MRPGSSGPRRPDWLDSPDASRLAEDHPMRAVILAAHRRACDSGLSSYIDPASGYSVLTAAYLSERGYCCDQGCRHCPWVGATS